MGEKQTTGSSSSLKAAGTARLPGLIGELDVKLKAIEARQIRIDVC